MFVSHIKILILFLGIFFLMTFLIDDILNGYRNKNGNFIFNSPTLFDDNCNMDLINTFDITGCKKK
jgi:hypothetical protein